MVATDTIPVSRSSRERSGVLYAVALAAVLLIGAVIRLYSLSTVPTELIVDELDLYNSAASIVTTGHDIDGTLQPFLYSQFTRNPPLYGYAAYASSLVFGKNAVGLRMPAVLFGLLTIFFVYLLVLELTRRRDVALFSAVCTCVAPVFVQFSRIAWEPSCELPFLLGGLYLLVRTLQRLPRAPAWRSAGGFMLSAVLLAVTCYTYMAGWFYAALLSGALVLLNVRRVTAARAWLPLLLACALGVLLAYPALHMIFLDPLTAGKAQRISTFANGVTLQAIGAFFRNYASHFLISFLVTTGDPQNGSTWRYLNGFGAFYWWIIPLAAAGFFAPFSLLPDRALRIWLIVWLLAYPLGGALTNEAVPNVPRTLAGMPVFCIFAGLGYAYLLPSAPRARTIAAMTSAAIVALSVARFCDNYFTQYVHRNPNAWDSGTRATFATVLSYRTQYERVCFSIYPAYYGIDTYVRFYIAGAMETVENLEDARCWSRGTLIVTDNDHPLSRLGFKRLAKIDDVNGDGFAFIYGYR
jgi:4-amino-4-deoxy-L-arabinose transferase-like glycosyltransferase